MFERFIRFVFFACLVACASMVLGAVWGGKAIQGPLYFQTTATLFVIGLASFLTWFVLTLRRVVRMHQSSPL